MPCRKENYIFLEQSVTVDPKEVDALVTKIGEALQLHNNNNNNGGGAQQKTRSGSVPGGCCMRLRNRVHRGGSRASPYSIPGSNGEQDWDQIRPWNKKRIGVGVGVAEDDDPHRLLQKLILSGNLIKEAVRRLQFPDPDCGDSVPS